MIMIMSQMHWQHLWNNNSNASTKLCRRGMDTKITTMNCISISTIV